MPNGISKHHQKEYSFKKHCEDIDEDNCSDTASSKEQKHTEFASVDNASSYLNNGSNFQNQSHNNEDSGERIIIGEGTGSCHEEINLVVN